MGQIYIFLLLTAVYLFSYMLSIYDENWARYSHVARIGYYLYCLAVIVRAIVFAKRVDAYEAFLFIYLFVYVALLLFHGDFDFSALNSVIYFPLVSLCFSFLLKGKRVLMEDDMRSISQVVLFFLSVNLIFFLYNIFSLGVTSGLVINTIYFTVTSAIFALFLRSFFIKIAVVSALMSVCLAVGKGAPFLALMVVAFFLVWEFMFKNGSSAVKISSFLVFLVALTLLALMSIGYLDKIDFSILSSGRTGLYARVLGDIYETNLSELFFGHGFNGVAEKYGYSSHNDFLEVIYNFGLVGLILYISIYLYMVFHIGGNFKRSKQGALYPLLSVFLVFFTLSSVSHLIFIPSYSVYIYLALLVCIRLGKGREYSVS